MYDEAEKEARDRQNGRCADCNEPLAEHPNLYADRPISEAGSGPENLVALCLECYQKRMEKKLTEEGTERRKQNREKRLDGVRQSARDIATLSSVRMSNVRRSNVRRPSEKRSSVRRSSVRRR